MSDVPHPRIFAKDQPDETQDVEVISYLTMRQTLGWCGVLLPFVMLAGGWWLHGDWFTSISAYYYTGVGHVFVAILVTIGLFLLAYKGYPKKPGEWVSDNMLANVSGAAAIGVALFPTKMACGGFAEPPVIGLRTSCPPPYGDYRHLFGDDEVAWSTYQSWFADQIVTTSTTGYLHFTCAAVFFVTIAYMAGVHFRRERIAMDGRTRLKLWRDRLFLGCSLGMAGCLALIILYFLWENAPGVLPELRATIDVARPVFVLEAVAVVLFGLAWLAKGRQIMDDRAGSRSVFQKLAEGTGARQAI